MRFDLAEKYRAPHPSGWSHKNGDEFGWFEMPTTSAGPKIRIQANKDFGGYVWQHVSVSLANRCPAWDEMCKVKDLFWEPEETVVQFHPPHSEYVNNHKYCLHLWCYKGEGEMPRPTSDLVGFK